MGNMSYCRFENTYGDLRDCQEALDSEGFSSIVENANQYEAPYVKRLIELCVEIANDYGHHVSEDSE